MKKPFALTALLLSLAGAAHAQFVDDVISGGDNSWILHTPDDGRTELYLAPGTSGTSWNWGNATQFSSNGDVRFPGKVRLGPQATIGTHADYRLAVDGKLTAKSIYVLRDNSTNWADYVFAKDYRLAPLAEVEAYIASHGHLPEIPTTSEVAANGINVAQMNTLLLKKVEELTLHLIRIQKEVDRLKTRQPSAGQH